MEKVQSLIYRLQQQAASKATADELLFTTELLFQQLAKYANISVFTTGPVAVWLPKGMSAAGARNLVWQDKPSATQIQHALNSLPAEKPASYVSVVGDASNAAIINSVAEKSEEAEDLLLDAASEEVAVVMPENVSVHTEAVQPPLQEAAFVNAPESDLQDITLSDEDEEAVENIASNEEIYEEHVRHIITPESSIEVKPAEYVEPIINTSSDTEVFELSIDPDDEELKQLEQIEKYKKEEQDRELTQQEVTLPEIEEEEYKPEPVVLTSPKTSVESEAPKEDKSIFNGLFGNLPKSAADVVKNVFNNAANLVHNKPADIHHTEHKAAGTSTVENTGINKAVSDLNEKFKSTGNVGLNRINSGSTEKINDLRKAFTINEKYQMIQSLFRGDEDMFERTLRTINNFETVNESRYWIQRELVFKLGWNDDDELVQLFYAAVAKKFG